MFSRYRWFHVSKHFLKNWSRFEATNLTTCAYIFHSNGWLEKPPTRSFIHSWKTSESTIILEATVAGCRGFKLMEINVATAGFPGVVGLLRPQTRIRG